MKNFNIFLHTILFIVLIIASLSSIAETYSYDSAGRLTGVTYDNGSSISYNYDNNGNLLSRTVAMMALKKADLDGDGRADALTDGILFLRFLFGFTGNTLTDGVVSPGATRSMEEIEQHLTAITSSLECDIDDDGRVDALTDGILFIRFLFGFRGAALIDGVVAANAQRTSADSIAAFMQDKVDN